MNYLCSKCGLEFSLTPHYLYTTEELTYCPGCIIGIRKENKIQSKKEEDKQREVENYIDSIVSLIFYIIIAFMLYGVFFDRIPCGIQIINIYKN